MGRQGLCGAQAEAVRNRGEFVAAADAVFAEARCENAAHGRDERGSAGQEDSIDRAGMNAGGLQQTIDAALDGFEIVLDPGFKLGARDGNAQIDCRRVAAAVVEAELCRRAGPSPRQVCSLDRPPMQGRLDPSPSPLRSPIQASLRL